MPQVTLLMLVLLLLSSTTGAEETKRVRTGHPDAVQVMLPKGKFTVSYVEAAEGMMVYLESQGLTVKRRKVFIGDGQIATPFEARHDGFFLPEGKRNVGGVEYEAGAVIKCAKENRHVWAEKGGEVYVLIPGITFEETK